MNWLLPKSLSIRGLKTPYSPDVLDEIHSREMIHEINVFSLNTFQNSVVDVNYPLRYVSLTLVSLLVLSHDHSMIFLLNQWFVLVSFFTCIFVVVFIMIVSGRKFLRWKSHSNLDILSQCFTNSLSIVFSYSSDSRTLFNVFKNLCDALIVKLNHDTILRECFSSFSSCRSQTDSSSQAYNLWNPLHQTYNI